jgi:hypothetical protein
LSVAAAAGVGWLLTYTMLSAGDASLLAVLPATLALVASGLLWITLRSGYTVTAEALRHVTWSGTTVYPRSAFLGAETVEDTRAKPGLLLRFENGILLLSDGRGCSDPEAVKTFLEQTWHVSSIERQRVPAGPVKDNLVFQYESVHLFWLGLLTVLLAAGAALGPMFWASAVVAFFTGRAFHRLHSCRRISTDREGIIVTRPLRPQLRLNWDSIRSVRYWYSLAHGGMVISDGTNTIRIYRWLQNYPQFNRLVQDNAPVASFPTPAPLPWTISLNRRRQSSWLVLLVTAGISLWLAAEGAWPAAVILLAVPSATFLFTVLASGRKIEIGHDRLRLIEKKGFREHTQDYLRADLKDMRLGRQLSAGGLWLRFGDERLEIGNLDSERAPEEILATLRREWRADVGSSTGSRAA